VIEEEECEASTQNVVGLVRNVILMVWKRRWMSSLGERDKEIYSEGSNRVTKREDGHCLCLARSATETSHSYRV